MTTAALIKQIKEVIETIDDNEVLEAVFVLLNNNAKHSYLITEEDMKIVAERKAAYKTGKAKTYTVDEVRKKILKNHRK